MTRENGSTLNSNSVSLGEQARMVVRARPVKLAWQYLKTIFTYQCFRVNGWYNWISNIVEWSGKICIVYSVSWARAIVLTNDYFSPLLMLTKRHLNYINLLVIIYVSFLHFFIERWQRNLRLSRNYCKL